MATLLNRIKLHRAIDPDLKDDAAFDGQVIDKQDFDGAKGVLFVIYTGFIDVALAALKVQQADAKTDATTLTSGADVHDVTAKPTASDDNEFVLVYVPMSLWTKRYLQLQATGGDGTTGVYLAAVAIADMPGETAVTAASLNVEAVEIAS